MKISSFCYWKRDLHALRNCITASEAVISPANRCFSQYALLFGEVHMILLLASDKVPCRSRSSLLAIVSRLQAGRSRNLG